MIEQKKKKINGVTYLVTQMDGIRALRTVTALIKILGPAVASILTGTSLDLDVIKSTFLQKLPDILSNFDDKRINNFILYLFEHGVLKEGKNNFPEKVDFELDFGGKINDMWKVALFILEVNFFAGKPIKLFSPTIAETKKTKEN